MDTGQSIVGWGRVVVAATMINAIMALRWSRRSCQFPWASMSLLPTSL